MPSLAWPLPPRAGAAWRAISLLKIILTWYEWIDYLYSINSAAKRYQISDTQRVFCRCPFLTPAEGELKAEECELCFHECKVQRSCSTLSNVAYARHSRGKITQSVKLNRKNNFINLTNSPLYKPFCSVLFAKKRYKNSPPWPSSCILFVEQWATSRNLPSELNSVVWRGTPPLSRKPSDNRKKLRHSRAKRDCLRRKPKNHDKKGGFLDINAFLCGGNLRIAPKFCVS